MRSGYIDEDLQPILPAEICRDPKDAGGETDETLFLLDTGFNQALMITPYLAFKHGKYIDTIQVQTLNGEKFYNYCEVWVRWQDSSWRATEALFDDPSLLDRRDPNGRPTFEAPVFMNLIGTKLLKGLRTELRFTKGASFAIDV